MLNLAPSKRQVNHRETAEKPDQRFVRLNKNLANYPLARDPRVRVEWWRSKNNDNWCADLPGDKRLRLILPDDIHPSFKRVPTAFDINVLALLSAEASRWKSDQIRFAGGRQEFMCTLGLDPRSGSNQRRLTAALDYWTAINIKFDKCWYEAKKKQTTLYLDPPLMEASPARAQSFKVQIGEQWWGLLNKGYFEVVPLPLPADAAAQNIVLAVMVSKARTASGMYELSFERPLGSFCKKIGLVHDHTRQQLPRAAALAEDWFADHGGELVCRIDIENDGMIRFMMKKPQVKLRGLVEIDDAERERRENSYPLHWRKKKKQQRQLSPLEEACAEYDGDEDDRYEHD